MRLKRTVFDGPFSEANEVIGGYWLIQARWKEEALEWAKRIPFGTEVDPGHEVEVRKVFEFGSPRSERRPPHPARPGVRRMPAAVWEVQTFDLEKPDGLLMFSLRPDPAQAGTILRETSQPSRGSSTENVRVLIRSTYTVPSR